MKNKMFAVIKTIATFLTAIICFGCISDSVSFQKVEDFELQKFENDTLSVSLSAYLSKSGSFNVEVKSTSFELFLKDEIIGSGRSTQAGVVSGESIKLPLLLRIPAAKIQSLLAPENKNLEFMMKGKVDVKFLFIDKQINIEKPIKINFDSLVTNLYDKASNQKLVTIEQGTIKSFSLDKSIVKITIKVTNPLKVPIIIKNYPATLYINGKEVGTLKVSEPIKLEPNAVNVDGSIETEIDNFKSIGTLLGTLLSNKIAYKTDGFLIIEVMGKEFKIPYANKGELKVL